MNSAVKKMAHDEKVYAVVYSEGEAKKLLGGLGVGFKEREEKKEKNSSGNSKSVSIKFIEKEDILEGKENEGKFNNK